MTKRIVTIYISDKSKAVVDELGNGFNFSHWVDQKIQQELSGLDTLYLEKTKKETELAKINEKIVLYEKYAQQKKEEIQNMKDGMGDRERRFLKESKNILKRDMTFIDGRINLYKNEFGKKNLNKTDFLELLELVAE